MTTFKRWYLLLGFGVVLASVGPRGLQILWLAAALAFIGLVVYGVVRGRRRSYREFVEKPGAIVATFKKPAEIDHRWDAIL